MQAAAAVFNVIDEDGSGQIEASEMRKGLKMLGLDSVDEDTLEYVVKEFDTDGTGDIDKKEFVNMAQVCALCGSRHA